MPAAPTLPPALDAELDEVLGLLPLVAAEPAVADRVFDRLTDVLARAVLHDVRSHHGDDDGLGRAGHLVEARRTVVRLRACGLLAPRRPPA